jgi:hypothetical protein
MTNPEMIHLISEIPEPAAYLAKDWTRRAATKDNAAFWVEFRQLVIHPGKISKRGVACERVEREEGERDNAAPQTARI